MTSPVESRATRDSKQSTSVRPARGVVKATIRIQESGTKTVKRSRRSMETSVERTDAILAIQEPYMQQMVDGEKNYEFRKYLINPSVKRLWFYRTAPHSTIDYICEIEPARTRNPGDSPLEEDGLGNKEYNERHADWDRYDFAYKILSVYTLKTPVTLSEMNAAYGMKAPQGLVYVPPALKENVKWQEQHRVR